MEFGNEVAQARRVMQNEKIVYKDYLPESAIQAGINVVKKTRDLWEEVRRTILSLLKDEIPYESPHAAVWWYSVLLGIEKESKVFEEFIKYIRGHRDSFSPNTQFFLYSQLYSLFFRYRQLDCMQNKIELWSFYTEIVSQFAEQLHTPLEEIPFDSRKEQILVITEQFLFVRHGPTKTALDRCKTLMTKMGRDVLLLNTAELLSGIGGIPFYECVEATYDPSKSSEKEQWWKGVPIPYFQCENIMPDLGVMDALVEAVRELAPSWAVLIGGCGVFGSLIGKMVPTITVGTVPSELAITNAKYQTLGRKLHSEDIHILRQMGFTEQNVIEGIFTSSLKSQEEHITREALEVPKQDFLVIVVGARLDSEVTDAFLRMLEEIVQADMFIGFLGVFDSYSRRIHKFPHLEKKSAYLGFCQDILSRLELCDLYVNPIRKGGGTSCVEAMYKGIPVVTVDYGDVSVNAGKDFCVEDYKEMQGKILKYYNDKEYYREMSEKAVKRAKILLDTETEFVRIMQEAIRREETDAGIGTDKISGK